MSDDEDSVQFVGVDMTGDNAVLAIHRNASAPVISLFKMILKAVDEAPMSAHHFILTGLEKAKDDRFDEKAQEVMITMIEECLQVLAGFKLICPDSLLNSNMMDKGPKWLEAGQFITDLDKGPTRGA